MGAVSHRHWLWFEVGEAGGFALISADVDAAADKGVFRMHEGLRVDFGDWAVELYVDEREAS
jgi:hypothetical protein